MKSNSINPFTIMIVDDNSANLAVLDTLLKDSGYEIVVATSGETALKRIEYSRPDLILLDVIMPGINGFEVCRNLKSDDETKDIPIIFMTALSNQDDKVKGFRAGAVDYISKPIQKDELLARVNTHLRIFKHQEFLESVVADRTKELERQLSATKREIDERKRVERELIESQRMQRDMLNNSSTFVYIKSPDGKYLSVNKEFEKLSHLKENEIQGKYDRDIFPEETAGHFRENDLNVLESDKLMQFEEVSQLKDGIHTYISNKFPLKNIDGEIYAICGISIDITERKKAEKALIELRNYLANVIDSMPSTIITLSSERRITHWNNTAERITGVQKKEAIGRKLNEVLPYLDSQMDCLEASIVNQSIERRRLVPRMIGGKLLHEEIIIYPLIDNGETGAVIRIDDISENVKMEEIIVQSEKMLSIGGLAAGMAHEINNPLAGIVQSTSVLESRLINILEIPANVKAAEEAGTTVEAVKRYMDARGVGRILSSIEESGIRVSEIINNMLSFARKSEGTFSSYPIEELIDKTIELASSDYNLKSKFDFKNIEIVRNYRNESRKIPCESGKIQQVFLNILQNGAQAMFEAETPNPHFTITTSVKDDFYKISIKDNGPGMTKEIRDRIFEPFFTTKPENSGTGLGLSVSYYIISENHNGRLSVISEPEKGAEFIIELPLYR